MNTKRVQGGRRVAFAAAAFGRPAASAPCATRHPYPVRERHGKLIGVFLCATCVIVLLLASAGNAQDAPAPRGARV